jgi:hypothetical protein
MYRGDRKWELGENELAFGRVIEEQQQKRRE